jgi:predicted Zn-dependent peptidase
LPQAELDRAKNLVRAQLLRGLSTSNGRAHTIGNIELMLGSWRSFLDLPDRYSAVTAEEIQKVAQTIFAPHRRNVVTLVPGEVVS